MSYCPFESFLRPLMVLPPLAGVFFAAVSFMTTRTWGFSVASGVVVFFGSFVVLAIMYSFVDAADSGERRAVAGRDQDVEQSR